MRAGFTVVVANGQSLTPLSAGRVNKLRRLTAALLFRSWFIPQDGHCQTGSRLSFAFTFWQLEQVLLEGSELAYLDGCWEHGADQASGGLSIGQIGPLDRVILRSRVASGPPNASASATYQAS